VETRMKMKTATGSGRLPVLLGSVCKAVLAGFVCMGSATSAPGQAKQEVGWPAYGADEAGTRYSPAKQIDRSNVDKLKVAWIYRTGAMAVATRLV